MAEEQKPEMREEAGEKRLSLDQPLDRARLATGFDPQKHGMVPLALETLSMGEAAPVDIYLPLLEKGGRKVRMALVCAQDEFFKPQWRDRLTRAEQQRIYVPADQVHSLNDYFRRTSDALLSRDDMTTRKRAVVLQEMAALNLRVFFGVNPSDGDIKMAATRSADMISHMGKHPQIMTNLSEVLRTDYSIFSRSVNVCMLSMAMGMFLGYDEPKVHALGLGALLHDVGMSKLPKTLLEKTGALSPEETRQMHRHPRLAYQMLLNVGAVPYDSLMIVLHHHENADGSGYPDGLAAERTPYLARLVRVIDAFDAMTSQRPFRDAKTAYDAAQELIEGSQEVFGADIVRTFIRFLGSPYVRGQQA